MAEEILEELDDINPPKEISIKHIQKLLGDLAIEYLTNLNLTDEQKVNIKIKINLYKNELDKIYKIMENNIISYFSKIYNNHKFEFLKKNNGRQSGNILKIIDLFNNYETIYYLKTHQDGSTYLSSTKYHLDIKELYL